MTHSYRRWPLSKSIANHTAKWWKRSCSRATRKRNRQRLYLGEWWQFYLPRELYDPWNSPKDGGWIYDPIEHPEVLRK